MLTAILILIGDLAIGAMAWKQSKANDAQTQILKSILDSHESRITALERR
jgi:hypothetical protein